MAAGPRSAPRDTPGGGQHWVGDCGKLDADQFLIFGCVSKKRVVNEEIWHEDKDEGNVVFGAGVGGYLYLSMIPGVLSAAYSCIGQRGMLVVNAEAELEAGQPRSRVHPECPSIMQCCSPLMMN